jgi:hypothetical protein
VGVCLTEREVEVRIENGRSDNLSLLGERQTLSRARSLRILLFLAASSALVLGLAAAASAPVDVSGTWAEMQVYREFATLPLVGEAARTSTVLLLVTMEQTGSSLIMRETYCSTKIDNGTAIASTTIPTSFLRSLAQTAKPASLDASETTTRFTQPWYTEVRGARLDDPERDALPTQADDPRVFDQDGDGKPGLTVHVSALVIFTGDVYVVQRVRYRLEGVVVTPDRIEGLIEWTTEQITLGTTSSLFEGELPSRPDPVAAHSFFVLQRIDPSWDCKAILAHRDAIFGQ